MSATVGVGGPPLTVDIPALRAAAAHLTDEAYALGHGLAGTPGLVPPLPQWSVTAALSGLESAVHAWFGALGGRVAEAGAGIRTAADGYHAADDRAARRLPGPGR
ncbi:hypothetical protein [Micromonospora cathayae]|uniref:Excreted virulence factor EspC, type VII ESX diderm n=1 Tax=Micromonospora cathayae TaxID=3028804 RepID=A0ABY7ZS37_9ACTN|nr:hypothetical protein [Micromonospora sp. HUAS 3]WDZ85293.1 hypothetical protein PVK37_02170 [Micromonospora sp. HUAS 3]